MKHISYPDTRPVPGSVPCAPEKNVCSAIEWGVLQLCPCLDALAYKQGQTPLPRELFTQAHGEEVHRGTIAALHPEPQPGVEKISSAPDNPGVPPQWQVGPTEKHSAL